MLRTPGKIIISIEDSETVLRVQERERLQVHPFLRGGIQTCALFWPLNVPVRIRVVGVCVPHANSTQKGLVVFLLKPPRRSFELVEQCFDLLSCDEKQTKASAITGTLAVKFMTKERLSNYHDVLQYVMDVFATY